MHARTRGRPASGTGGRTALARERTLHTLCTRSARAAARRTHREGAQRLNVRVNRLLVALERIERLLWALALALGTLQRGGEAKPER
eukprot:602187-Prymnesium_polylepis.2